MAADDALVGIYFKFGALADYLIEFLEIIHNLAIVQLSPVYFVSFEDASWDQDVVVEFDLDAVFV